MPHLTNELVLGLESREKPYKVFDDLLPGKKKNQGVKGLLVRVCPGGAKTFAVSYIKRDGGKGWMPIGRFGIYTVDQARDEAGKHLLAVSQGQDPAKKLREDREAPTLAELVDRFVEDHAKGKAARTAAEYERLMRKHLVSRLGTRKVQSIGTGDMADLLGTIRKESGPVEANRALAVARKMFNLAELWELRDRGTNPLTGQARAPEAARDRRMVEAEVRALGQIIREVEALGKSEEKDGATLQPESTHALAAVKLYLLAGFRKEEALCLRWPWIDLEKGMATIPPEFHKTGRKTKKPRIVYLCPEAVDILRALPRLDQDEDAEDYNTHVIVGARKGSSLVQIQDVWERLRTAVSDRAKHEAKKHKKKTPPAVSIEDVHLHDLRRTFASVAADLGHPELVIKGMLGHQGLTSVTQVYTRLSVDPIREAVNQVGGAIAGWLGFEAPKAAEDPAHF